MGGRSAKTNCHPGVKALCKKATCNDHACHKTTNASLLPGREINAYLLSLESGYGTESRQGISIKPNALNDAEEYMVCANLKKNCRLGKNNKKEKEC